VDNDSHLNFTNELNSQGMETYGAHYNGGRSQSMAGWTAGVGAEYKLSSGVGIKLEYSHYDLGTATANAYRPNLSYYHLQSNFPTGGNLVRLAFDYHFGGSRDYSDYQIYDEYSGTMVPAPAYFSPLRYEFGTRYWYSNGTFRYDLHGSGNNVINGVNSNSALVSRLSYTGEHSNSGEIYGSAKYPGGFQVNAMLGGGAASGGTLRDEDFPPFIDPYSRTESTQKTGALTYSIVDVGYSVFSRYGFSIVPFLGYAYDREQLNAYGCTQVASNQDVCGNAGGPPVYSGALTISENGTWSAMRAGIGANYALPWHDLRFGVNGAWLPFGSLAGNDDHWLRIDTPNASTFSGPIVQTGTAHGMQLEATAKIALTDKVDLGVGGRYWYFFTHGTSEFFSPFYEPGKQSTTFTTRRYGEFVELSTHF